MYIHVAYVLCNVCMHASTYGVPKNAKIPPPPVDVINLHHTPEQGNFKKITLLSNATEEIMRCSTGKYRTVIFGSNTYDL